MRHGDVDPPSSQSSESLDDVDGPVTDATLTARLFDEVKRLKPVTIDAKAPTVDDVRSVLNNKKFECGTELWKLTVPKRITSR